MLPLVATTNTSSAGLTHGNLSAKTTAKHHLQNGLLLQYSYRDGEQETRSQAVARIADRTSLVVLGTGTGTCEKVLVAKTNSNQRAVCSFYRQNTVITDRIRVTSNFLKHLQRM